MELLKQLYKVHSPSGAEKPMKRFVKKWITKQYYADSVTITYDQKGNMYITKGISDNYPCIVAHLDQVQDAHSSDFEVIEVKDVLFGYSAKSRRQEGLGADDKNGIWVGLNCLSELDVVKVALFVEEEIGCGGSEAADMDFFKDCNFVVQCDRRGSSDLITNISYTELCSADFVADIEPSLFGYSEQSGLMSDVLALKSNGLGVSCVNMSCGYYEPHSDTEYTVISELRNALNFVFHIVGVCDKPYIHTYQDPIFNTPYSRHNNHYYWGESWNYKEPASGKSASASEINSLYDELFEIMCDELSGGYEISLGDMIEWYGESYSELSSDAFRLCYESALRTTFNY